MKTNIIRYVPCFLLLSLTNICAQEVCNCPDTYEYFREDFDGPNLDTRIWKGKQWLYTHQLNQGATRALEYWVNFDRPEHHPENIYQFGYDSNVESNVLTLNTINEPITARLVDYLPDTDILSYNLPNLRSVPYQTGMLWSKQLFKYGIYRWRVKVPGNFGPYPSIWLYREHIDSRQDEIDVLEYAPYNPNHMPINIHYGYDYETSGHGIDADFNLSSGYADYALLWLPPNQFGANTPNVLMFGVAPAGEFIPLQEWDATEINSNMMMIINHGVGGSVYEGMYEEDETLDLSNETFPFQMKIDEVSVSTLMKCETVSICDFGGIEDGSVITGNRIELGGNSCSFKVPGNLKWEQPNVTWHGKNLDVISCKETILKSGFHAERGSEFHARSITTTSGKQNSWSDDILSQAHLMMADTSENRSPIRTPRVIREKNLALEKLNSPNTTNPFPNPTTGQLTLSHTQQLLTVEVYDPLGRQLLQTAPNTTTTSIDLSGQPAGIYIIRAGLDDGSTETHRVVLSPP